MKVCFFGIYDPAYSRNRVLVRGFEGNGWEVIHCRVDPRRHGKWRKYWRLYQEYRKVRSIEFDEVIVAFPGHTTVWLARLLFGRRIVFDAFLSLYDSNVNDRRLYSGRSLRGIKDWLLDWFGCRLARTVLVDTAAHACYFEKVFGVPQSKLVRVFVGAEAGKPAAAPATGGAFRVHFHGFFIPLQGTAHIVEAAGLLKDENIFFTLVGDGQEYAAAKERSVRLGLERSVAFPGRVPFDRLCELIAEADVCLGIFGETGKASRVIPNKVYEYAAMGKPIVTADSPAIREAFADRESVLLCRAGDARSLADAVLELRDDPALRKRIAGGAQALFDARLRPEVVVAQLLADLKRLR